MQQGDLQLWTVPRTVIILEGVLCHAMPIEQERRFRGSRISGYHTQWYDVPLKRMVYLKERWPETSMEIVTFISQEFLDSALIFLDQAQIPYDQATYTPFEQFCSLMRFQNDLRAVYDSDLSRLEHYGQYGVAVQRGFDF